MSGKLPESVIPINYNLLLEPSLTKFNFKGRVITSIRVREPTNKIVLNSKDLKITRTFLQDKEKIIHPEIKMYEEEEIIVLIFQKKLPISSYTLTLEFEGHLKDNLTGFYRSKYQEGKRTKYLATSQFEAPYARQCFPCFDQPDMKATFDLSLIIDKKLSAISNMPVIYEEFSKKHKLIKFEKTPLMSTYLLYIGVGEFEYLHDTYKNKVKLRIVTTKGKSKQGKFALDLTKKFLEYFEKYSEVPYPLPKLDLLAIPDFGAGAMENWGAITFREILLLFDEKKTSIRVKKRIAEVIAHELWHQWSGNLVTMRWWDDLWLNESFATYMAFKALDHYFPEWKMWEDFVEGETSEALVADTLKTTHPIAVKVSTPNEVEEIFDKISYGKGGSVLRMIDSFIGEENFRKGVSNYLKSFKYGNAEAKDLWNSLSKTSNYPIKEVLESWINQKGYPLLIANSVKKGEKIALIQKPFNQSKGSWLIPCRISNGISNKRFLLRSKKTIISNFSHEFFNANYMQEGFYRVKYDKENLEQLKEKISSKKIGVSDRRGIQNDLFNMSIIGEISIDNYLDFIKCYRNENSYLVLSDIYSNIYSIYLLFSDSHFWKNIKDKFNNHLSEPYKRQLKRLGWTPKKRENINDSLLRSICISFLSFTEDKKTILEGKKIFKKYKSLHPDISGAIYALVASNGNEETYDLLRRLYESHPVLEEKLKLLSAIYKFRSESIIKNALNYSLTPKVRKQELSRVFSAVSANPVSKKTFLPWFKENWSKLKDYQKINYLFRQLLETLITSNTEKEKLVEIANFLKIHKIKYSKTKANAFEIAQMNSTFIKRNSKILENYFK